MSQPLTIAQAEKRLSSAWGHTIKVWRDFNGYFARISPGNYLPLYDQTRMNPDNTSTITVTPAVGDWPDVDLTECGVPAENEAADFAQRWNERRGA